jgi:hypothetical protein
MREEHPAAPFKGHALGERRCSLTPSADTHERRRHRSPLASMRATTGVSSAGALGAISTVHKPSTPVRTTATEQFREENLDTQNHPPFSRVSWSDRG